jgi:hypothetical protein
MAQLLCINENTFREGINRIGDIIAIFPDNHIFSKAEIDGFAIVQTKGEKNTIYSSITQALPVDDPDYEFYSHLKDLVGVEQKTRTKYFFNVDLKQDNSLVLHVISGSKAALVAVSAAEEPLEP